jgi:hypothetical protein
MVTGIWHIGEDSSGSIIGCSFWRVLGELHINNLAVVPECRRRASRHRS